MSNGEIINEYLPDDKSLAMFFDVLQSKLKLNFFIFHEF